MGDEGRDVDVGGDVAVVCKGAGGERRVDPRDANAGSGQGPDRSDAADAGAHGDGAHAHQEAVPIWRCPKGDIRGTMADPNTPGSDDSVLDKMQAQKGGKHVPRMGADRLLEVQPQSPSRRRYSNELERACSRIKVLEAELASAQTALDRKRTL